jgi:hypothetical protein
MRNTNQSLIPRYEYPASDELRAVYMRRWGSSSPEGLRTTAHASVGMPDERRAWLLALADRIEASEYRTFGDVPADHFDEFAELY